MSVSTALCDLRGHTVRVGHRRRERTPVKAVLLVDNLVSGQIDDADFDDAPSRPT